MKLNPHDDAYPLSDPADVQDARHEHNTTWLAGGPAATFLPEAERFSTADELRAARELEEWGYNPFALEDA